MPKSVEIRNFRGFHFANLTDCRRINVIVGANGTGKTALLEALFLATGSSAELCLRTRQWRGFESAQASGTPSQIDQSLWSDLFYKFDRNAKLSITLGGTRPHERQLGIKFLPQEHVLVPLKGRQPVDSGAPTVESVVTTAGVSFDWRGPFKQHIVSIARLQDGKLSFSSSLESPINGAFFAANHPTSMLETVGRFSALSMKGEAREAVETFKQQFPIVRDISIEVSAGIPILYASVERNSEKIPLALLSAGMTRLSSLLFAIPGLRNGILLIDEIENGFYYKKLPSLWRALYSFCTQYDVQLFASTHSAECLKSAAEVSKDHPEEFSLIRAELEKDGCTLRQFTGDELSAAVDADVEIR